MDNFQLFSLLVDFHHPIDHYLIYAIDLKHDSSVRAIIGEPHSEKILKLAKAIRFIFDHDRHHQRNLVVFILELFIND